MAEFYSQQGKWLQEAESLEPKLHKRTMKPVSLARPMRDESAFQGWRVEPAGEVEEAYSKIRERTWEESFDFGSHYVGRLSFKVELEGICDSPLKLKILFAELPAEIGMGFDCPEAKAAGLGHAWLQEEVVVVDLLPAEIKLPRRYAFRYVKISAEGNSPYYKTRISGLSCETESSVDLDSAPPLPKGTPESLRRIDSISLRTLANCMQSVFEDGPKRDRRLWLGDFRLQALLNYASFRNFEISKRCLLLFAGLADENGLVATNLYTKPQLIRGKSDIYDYISIFPACVHEYAKASGDWSLAEELWPVALRQMDFVLGEHAPNGSFLNKAGWWRFIDWSDIDKTAAIMAVSVYALKTAAALGRDLGRNAEADPLEKAAANLQKQALEQLFDSTRGVFVSGPDKQVSWASQIWMTLAGVVEGKTAAKALLGAMNDPAALPAVAPYLHHFLVEALLAANLEKEAFAHIEGYWGEMARLGADTFWEVFDPKDQKRSPYSSHLMNSACHAWSCTPSLFIRTAKTVLQFP